MALFYAAVRWDSVYSSLCKCFTPDLTNAFFSENWGTASLSSPEVLKVFQQILTAHQLKLVFSSSSCATMSLIHCQELGI